MSETRTEEQVLETATRAAAALAELGYKATPSASHSRFTGCRTASLQFARGSIPIEAFWKAWWTAGSPNLACRECYKAERTDPGSLRTTGIVKCLGRGLFPPTDCGLSERVADSESAA